MTGLREFLMPLAQAETSTGDQVAGILWPVALIGVLAVVLVILLIYVHLKDPRL